MKRRIYPLLVCVFLIGFTDAEKVNSKPVFVQPRDDIFIDEPAQADAVEGSAAESEFDPDQAESSGIGPDDEDSVPGSGFTHETGSGEGPVPVITEKTTHSTVGRIITSTTTTQQTTVTTTKVAPPAAPTKDVNSIPELVTSPPKTASGKTPPPHDDDNTLGNEVAPGHVMGQRADERPPSFFAQPGILAAVIGGAVVGLLCAILLVMFIVYRMRKKDEGSYPLDEPKRSPTVNSYTRNTKEFYA